MPSLIAPDNAWPLWARIVVPGLLDGIWGYVIGTFIGILVTEALLKLFAK